MIDVHSCAETIAGLAALGFGEAARRLANPFRIVVNKGGLYFYSFGDRKHLDLWLGWSSMAGLAVTVMRPRRGWSGQTEGLNAIEVTAVDDDGKLVTFPLLAREPGSGFGAATGRSSPREQQEFIAQIDHFYKQRRPVSDTTRS